MITESNRTAPHPNEPSTLPQNPVHWGGLQPFATKGGSDETHDSVRALPRILHVGIDWGTSSTCVASAWAGEAGSARFEIWPTLVGYAKEGIVENLIPGNADVLCAQEAIRHRLHLNLVQPMVNGIIRHPEAARAFARHLRQQLPHGDAVETRAVIGIPANSTPESRLAIRDAMYEVFDRLLLVPKPFLAAIGCRDEQRLDEPGAIDPVVNSLWVDIGAGTTDLCLLQGCYPGADEQIGLPIGGDFLDERLMQGLRASHPDIRISPLKIRELKEQLAFAGSSESPAIAELFVGGRLQKVDVTEAMSEACHHLLTGITEALIRLLARADSESSPELLRNIFLTGGGSAIQNIAKELERMLSLQGIEGAHVRKLEAAGKDCVAKGALKASRQAREKQWQILLK